MTSTQGQKARQDATLVADITHDLAIARWWLLQQGVDHGIAGECEAPVEPRRDREPCLTIGVHAKPAGLHQERVFQCRVVLAAWLRVTVWQQQLHANRLFRSKVRS